MERFSIREYTCQMRSVDVMKCWPFGPTNIDYIQAFLPAITVKKFKWWTDELENELTEDLTCPVCFVFKAVSAQELNGHVSRCIVQLASKENSRMRSKSRMPKKRSIVELFAVAPPVDKVYEDEDEDGDDLSDQDDHVKLSAMMRTRFDEKRSRKMKSRDLSVVNVRMNSKKRKSGMKKAREADAIDISINRKDKLLAPKEKHTFNPTKKVTASPHILEYAKKLGDAIPDQKNQNLKCYSAGKRTKAFGASKLTLGKKKSVFSFHCILKKHSKVVSGNKSTINTFPDSNEANWCSINHSNRHVRFSGKDDILGRRMKSAPHDIISSETNLLAEKRDGFCPVNLDKSKSSSSINREENNEIFSVTEKPTPDTCLCVEKLSFSRPDDTQENLVDRPVSSNKVAYYSDHGYEVASPDSSSACPPGSVSVRKISCNPSITTRGDENLSMSYTSKAKVISHYVDDPKRDGTCFKDYVTSFPQASSSSYVSKENWNAYGDLQISSHSASEKYTGQILRYHPIPHLSPKELMHSLCSLPEMERRRELHLGRSRNGDYMGLPLNSHGEYIQLSSGKGGFNQTIRPAIFTDSSRTLAFCTEPPSNQNGQLSFINHDERLPPEKQCHFLSSHGQFKEKPNFMEASSLGTTGGTDASLEFRSCDSIYPYKSGINLMNIPSQSNRNDQPQNHSNDGNMYPERHTNLILGNGTQPTMRLMGQEFSIGKNYRNLHEGQNVWMDNQIMVHHDGDAISYESSRRHFQQDLMMQPGTAKNKKIASSSEIQIDMLSQSVFQIIPPDSRFTSPTIGCQSNAVYENACRTFGGVSVPQTYPYVPPYYSPAICKRGSSSQETFARDLESLPVNHQPVRASSSYNAYQSLSSNYVENSRMLPQPHSTSSAFKFPFLYTDSGEHAQPYNCQSSSKSITPSFLNAAQAIESTIGSFQLYPNAADSHHHCISSDNFQKSDFVRCTPDVPYIHNPLSFQSPLQNGPNLASIARPPPVRPRFLPTSTMNEKREYRLKFKERIKARLFAKDPQNKRTKKKLGTKSICSSMPVKLTTPENLSSGVTMSKPVDAEIDAVERKETTGLDRSGDVSNTRKSGQNATETSASKAESGNALEGPVQLTAGAEHIFNPSECMYGSNSKPTHSKVPFTTRSNSAICTVVTPS